MTLDVITPYSNPLGWRARLANHRRFEDAVLANPGVRLTTVELVHGDRRCDLPAREGVKRVRLQGRDILWQKENLIAIAERQLDYAQAAAVDGDLIFLEPDWAVQTVRALELHPLVQISAWLIGHGPPPAEPALRTSPSFMQIFLGDWSEHRQEWFDNGTHRPSRWGYPGGAWGWTRAAYHAMGGLLERCILGSADYHMALGVTGLDGDPVLANRDYSEAYRGYIAAWRRQAWHAIKGDVGLVPVNVRHLWHGRMEDRQYETRPRILVRNRYDPARDVRERHDGLLELAGNKPDLRRDILGYFRTRNEDSVDTPELDAFRRRHHPPRPEPPPHSHHHHRR